MFLITVVACSLCGRLRLKSLPSSIQILPIFVVCTAGEVKTEDTFPIQQSRLPSYFFPQGISCQDAHSPHYISSTNTIHLWNSAVSAAVSINAIIPFYASSSSPSSILSHSFRSPTGIKLQNIYPIFFFGQKNEHTGVFLRHSPTAVLFLDCETPMAVPGCSGSLPS